MLGRIAFCKGGEISVMKKLFLTVMALGIGLGITGCYEQPQYFYPVTTVDTNEIPVAKGYDYEMTGIPTPPTGNLHQVKNTREEITNLKGKITPLKKILTDFSKIGSIKSQTEFETYNDFINRKNVYLNNDFFKKTYFVCADNRYIEDHIKYNPYEKRFSFEVSNYPVEYIYAGEASFDQYPFSLLVGWSFKDRGSYIGQNVFGVSARIDKTDYYSHVLTVTNKDKLLSLYSTEKYSDYLSRINGYSHDIDSSTAESVKKYINFVYEFKPSVHYVYPKKVGVMTKTQKYDKPTLDSPSENMNHITVFFVELIGVHFVNTKTLDVIGSIYF